MPENTKQAERNRRFREANPGYAREWAAANRDKTAAANERYRRNNPAANRAKTQKWRAANKDAYNEAQKRWRVANVERLRAHERRYQAAKAGVLLTVHVDADHCGVCLKPLTALPFPDPMSTTVGHEPPLSVVAREGWKVVAERPEHWICNRRKWAKPDYQLEAVA